MPHTYSQFLGGSVAYAGPSAINKAYKYHRIRSATALDDFTLPAIGDYSLGGPFFYIHNDTAVSVEIRDSDSNLVLTLLANKIVKIFVTDGDISGGKSWYTSAQFDENGERTADFTY